MGIEHGVPLAILIVYGLSMGLISWVAARKMNREGGGLVSYLLAGRNLPTVLVAAMLTGLAVGGASTVGVAEQAYTVGISAGWYNGAWGTGGILVGLFLAGHFRKMKVRTVPQIMEKLYGPKVRVLSAVIQLLVMMTITSLQYVAGGAILTALLPEVFSFNGGMIASAVIFIGITLIGGYWASGLTNLLNVLVIYGGVVLSLVASFNSAGGFEAVVAALPEGGHWFAPIQGIGWGVMIGWMFVMITQTCSAQGPVQIALAAQDEKTARWGFVLGGILTFPVGFLCAFFGVIAAARFPGLENAALALPSIVTTISPLLGGIFLAALWAADVSTAIALLMGSSMLLVEDVWKRLWPSSITAKNEVAVSRWAVLITSVMSFLLALTAVGILRTMTSGLALTTPFTVLLLANIYCPRFCKKASGGWVLVAALVAWLLWTYVPSTRIGPHLIYLEWVLCGAVFLITSLLGKEPAGRLEL